MLRLTAVSLRLGCWQISPLICPCLSSSCLCKPATGQRFCPVTGSVTDQNCRNGIWPTIDRKEKGKRAHGQTNRQRSKQTDGRSGGGAMWAPLDFRGGGASPPLKNELSPPSQQVSKFKFRFKFRFAPPSPVVSPGPEKEECYLGGTWRK